MRHLLAAALAPSRLGLADPAGPDPTRRTPFPPNAIGPPPDGRAMGNPGSAPGDHQPIDQVDFRPGKYITVLGQPVLALCGGTTGAAIAPSTADIFCRECHLSRIRQTPRGAESLRGGKRMLAAVPNGGNGYCRGFFSGCSVPNKSRAPGSQSFSNGQTIRVAAPCV